MASSDARKAGSSFIAPRAPATSVSCAVRSPLNFFSDFIPCSNKLSFFSKSIPDNTSIFSCLLIFALLRSSKQSISCGSFIPLFAILLYLCSNSIMKALIFCSLFRLQFLNSSYFSRLSSISSFPSFFSINFISVFRPSSFFRSSSGTSSTTCSLILVLSFSGSERATTMPIFALGSSVTSAHILSSILYLLKLLSSLLNKGGLILWEAIVILLSDYLLLNHQSTLGAL